MHNFYKHISKAALVVLMLFATSAAFAQESVNVTFRFNASTVHDTVGANHSILINGEMFGNSKVFLDGETLGWDQTTPTALEHISGDYWQRTFRMNAGDTLMYKYRVYLDGGINKDDNDFDSTPNPKKWGTRFLIPQGDTVLDWAYFNNKSGGTVEETIPFTHEEDSISIYFRVDVGKLVQEGKFIPAEGLVGVRGEAPFSWDMANLELTKEALPDGYGSNEVDVFYSGLIRMHKDSVQAGSTINYKFVPEYPIGTALWEDGDNRVLTIPASDTTLQWKYHSNARPSTKPIITGTLTFNAKTAMMEALGLFNASVGDQLVVRGPLGWGTSEDNTLTFDDEALYYTRTIPNWKFAEGDSIKYKYYIEFDASRTDVNSDNYIEAIANDVDFGYEEPASTVGADRWFKYTDDPNQSTGTEFFGGLSLASVIQQQGVNVTFEIDMTPALDAEDPFNPATDSVYIAIESKVLAFTQDFLPGQGIFSSAESAAEVEFLRFKPVEGEDNIYSLTLPLTAPAVNDFGYTVGYGNVMSEEGLVFNGGGFDKGRRYYQFITPTSVEEGAYDPTYGQTYNVVWPQNAQLNRVTWASTDLQYETQPDYAGIATSIDDDASLPSGFALEQNYPNPFNPTTNIRFAVPQASDVRLEVFNILGQKVATLLNRKMTAGQHMVPFDGAAFSSGIYLYRITAGDFVDVKRMTLIK